MKTFHYSKLINNYYIYEKLKHVYVDQQKINLSSKKKNKYIYIYVTIADHDIILYLKMMLSMIIKSEKWKHINHNNHKCDSI